MTARRTTLSQLPDLAGVDLGVSEPLLVDQERINRFADATEDHQWIHVDTERAEQSPFGTTIAHGYLTLSLAPVFFFQLLEVEGADQVINYGLDKLRFPAPVPAGSQVELAATVADVTEARAATNLPSTPSSGSGAPSVPPVSQRSSSATTGRSTSDVQRNQG